MIANAANLLSNLSQFVGVVMAPRRAVGVQADRVFATVRSSRLLVIIVSPDGDVQNRVIFPEADYTQSQLVEASNYINAHYAGLTIEQVRDRLQSEVEKLRGEIAALMQAAVQCQLRSADRGAGGRRGDFRRTQPARRDRLLQRHGPAPPRLRAVRAEGPAHAPAGCVEQGRAGVRIFIGGESKVVPFEELSIVSANYEVDGQVVGTLGVIGPTRMPYDRMIQIVDITSQASSTNALSHRKTGH